MKAIGYTSNAPLTEPGVFTEFEAPLPNLQPYDLLVAVKAVSVNPVDYKIRASQVPDPSPRIIGYDSAGIVAEIGKNVSNFSIGDEVFYAGDISRSGSNAEFQAVDSRVVGKKPKKLSFVESAAVPLTSITAWELLFDSLAIEKESGQGKSILIIGGAGGVGSILIQLAKKLTKLTVIATASRPETIKWVKTMGADYVINHREPLSEQLQEINLTPTYVASLTNTENHFKSIIELIAPRGRVAIIDDAKILDITPGKRKSLSFHWELMFTRPLFQTKDIGTQGDLLNAVSRMLDDGELVTTLTNNLGKLNTENIVKAHTLQLSGRVIGKNVLEGF